jgi:hypothetical protein
LSCEVRPVTSNHRAPITLLLQVTPGSPFLLEVSQVPCHLASILAWSGRGSGSGAKLGFSGQKPVSMTPTMTPSPACETSPNCVCHAPPGPSRPRNVGVLAVCTDTVVFFQTLTTPSVVRSRATSAEVSFAAYPLKVVPYCTSVRDWLMPAARSVSACVRSRWSRYVRACHEWLSSRCPLAGRVAG